MYFNPGGQLGLTGGPDDFAKGSFHFAEDCLSRVSGIGMYQKIGSPG